ncbi:mitogen-activated protein kinase kinase kinase 1-like isoform X2 [Mustela erminea]|uniref:mitogen-activated protein kinase kinase kinase 1-like isoform X2 n=1 Tax=Mustela erminea TaxID=36723 RepID=UPI00138673FE|nr:mitogen-activated protein kinase kinase kinase 1-like isoform X2 [Mustela erminea]
MAGDAMVMPAERGGSQQWRGSRVSLERRAAPHERAFKGTAAAGRGEAGGGGETGALQEGAGGTTDPPSGGEPGRARVSGCLREADPTTGAAQEELLSGPSAFSPSSFALPPPPSLGPRLHRTPAPQHAQGRATGDASEADRGKPPPRPARLSACDFHSCWISPPWAALPGTTVETPAPKAPRCLRDGQLSCDGLLLLEPEPAS